MFLVEDSYAVPRSTYQTMNRWGIFGGLALMPFGGRGASAVQPKESHNRLTAIDISSQGKLHWSVGGEDGGREPKLAGAFFLGPPAVLRERLYVLAEITLDGVVRSSPCHA